jgi:hypothetical protein
MQEQHCFEKVQDGRRIRTGSGSDRVHLAGGYANEKTLIMILLAEATQSLPLPVLISSDALIV